MAKYSTNIGDGNEDTSCTICGEENVKLKTVKVEGSEIDVCIECKTDVSTEKIEDENKKSAGKKQEKTDVGYTISRTDSSWVDNVEYSEEVTPYLVRDYDEKVKEAMEALDIDLTELSDEPNINKSDINAVLNCNAVQENVGEKTIRYIEQRLNISIVDD